MAVGCGLPGAGRGRPALPRLGLGQRFVRRSQPPAPGKPRAHRAAAPREPAIAAVRGAGGREPPPARHARELRRRRRARAGRVDPQRGPRPVPAPRAARQGCRRRRLQGPGGARCRRHLRPGSAGARQDRRGDPDQRRRARDSRAVESQWPAHDRGRHGRLQAPVAAVRHGGSRPQARRPAALDGHGWRLSARIPDRGSHPGRAQCVDDVCARRCAADRAPRSRPRGAARLVRPPGRSGTTARG